ncbi:hypothetical protein BS78_01G146300 [Paspalum vaginatum]|nr:hypothetical protein BS78_01G146300 [Paspalum vaginatum]
MRVNAGSTAVARRQVQRIARTRYRSCAAPAGSVSSPSSNQLAPILLYKHEATASSVPRPARPAAPKIVYTRTVYVRRTMGHHRALLAALVAITAALHLLAAAAAARPMGRRRQAGGEATSALALAPAARDDGHHRHQRRAGDDDGVAAGKWLPFAGAHHHLPPAYWARRPVPWVGAGELGGAGAVVGGEGEEREREVPSYGRERDGGSGSATTRQEQLAMWASLLNPRGKGRTARGWLPGAGGAGEAADDEPAAKAADAVEGAEVGDQDQAQASGGDRVGQGTYWGNNGN